MTTWYGAATPEEADRLLAAWSDAPIENAELCGMILGVARDQVEAYAPARIEEIETASVDVRITYVNGVRQYVDLIWDVDIAPDFTGSITLPLSARGLRLEVEYVDGEDVAHALTTEPEIVPSNLRYAQLQQAQTLWNAGRTDGDGNAGTDGYSFVPRPLDKTIRSIIRPTSGVANVF